MRGLVVPAALVALSHGLMGRNMHDPFQKAVHQAEMLVAQLESELENAIERSLPPAHDFSDMTYAKAALDHQWFERQYRYSVKAKHYIRAQEKYFQKRELRLRKDAEVAQIPREEAKHKERKSADALKNYVEATDSRAKFQNFVDDLTDALVDFLNESEQSPVLEVVTDAFSRERKEQLQKKKRHSDELQQRIRNFCAFASLAIATQYVAARGVIFDPRNKNEKPYWSTFKDHVKWTLVGVPVVPPKSGGKGVQVQKLQLVALNRKKKKAVADTFLLKLVEKFRAMHANPDGHLSKHLEFGVGTIVAHVLRTGKLFAENEFLREAVSYLIKEIEQSPNYSSDPIEAMAGAVREAVKSERSEVQEHRWSYVFQSDKYYPLGVAKVAQTALERMNAIDDYFLLFRQPDLETCGAVNSRSKSKDLDCAAYVHAANGFKSAELDRLQHRMDRVVGMVDLLAEFQRQVPVANPQSGEALTPSAIREFSPFRTVIKYLRPDGDAGEEKITKIITDSMAKGDDPVDAIPTPHGPIPAERFGRHLFQNGFSALDVKAMLANFFQHDKTPGLKDLELHLKEMNEQLEQQEDRFNEELLETMDDDEREYKKQENQAQLEALYNDAQKQMDRLRGLHRYNNKPTHWLARCYEVFEAWKIFTKPVVKDGTVRSGVSVRPEQLVHYPKVKSILDLRLGLSDDTTMMRALMLVLSWGYRGDSLEYILNNMGRNRNAEDLLQALQDYRAINDVSLTDVRSWDAWLRDEQGRDNRENADEDDGGKKPWKNVKPGAWKKKKVNVRTDQDLEASIYCAKIWGHIPKSRNNPVKRFLSFLTNELASMDVWSALDETDKQSTKKKLRIVTMEGWAEFFNYLLRWLKAEANPSGRVETDQKETFANRFVAEAVAPSADCPRRVVGNEPDVDAFKKGWTPY